MKKLVSASLIGAMLFLAACGTTPAADDKATSQPAESLSASTASVKEYPKIEEISWSFRNSVQYGEPVAVFDYTNYSPHTITKVFLNFRMQPGITSEQLNLKKLSSDELFTDEEISEMKPYVNDWIVCDPGETAEGCPCYMSYNTEPTNVDQCSLMNLVNADIYFIADDGKEHMVSYSAENGGYSLSSQSIEPFVWIENDYSSLLPTPDTKVVESEQYDENRFFAKAYDMTYDAFLSYTTACTEMGFANEYPNEEIDHSFDATKDGGYELGLRYIDYMRCMEIVLKNEGNQEDTASAPSTSPAATDAATEATTSPTLPESTEPLVDGMRPEFKEAMDTYEAFYNEYCDFLSKYAQNPTDFSLLGQYAGMLSKAGEMDAAFKKWDEDDLNSAELQYYLEVNSRVLQKLAGVMSK